MINRTTKVHNDQQSILVVSYSIPNRTSGTPVVVRKFLENFRKDEVVLIGRPAGKNDKISNYSFHYAIYKIPTPPVATRGERLWRFLSILAGMPLGLYAIKTHKPKLILTFYRDESSLLTGYLLHKITGLPFYSYFCDIYQEITPKGIYGKLAAWLQPRVLSHSKKVFVLTEAMRDYYKQKYELDAFVLPHCNNLQIQKSFESPQSSPIKIGYLGSIGIDRIPSLRQLCEAINQNSRYFLTYFSSYSEAHLIQHGLKIPNSKIVFIASDELLIDELSKCDVFFLPVNSSEHQERSPQFITGFPTKAIDYFVCQKPILVHSKPNFFAARFFQSYRCGLVVDGGKDSIYAALEKLLNDSELRAELVGNAFSVLTTYFNGSVVAEKFRMLTAISE